MLAFKDILNDDREHNSGLRKQLWELSFIVSDTLKAGYVSDSKTFDDYITKIDEVYSSVKEEWRQIIVKESEKLDDELDIEIDKRCICGHHYLDHEDNSRCDVYLGETSSGDIYCACPKFILRGD